MGVSIQAQLETEVFSTENWGDYYYLNQDFEKAISFFSRTKDNITIGTQRNWALALEAIGEKAKARIQYESVVNSIDAKVEDYYNFANLLTDEISLSNEYREKAFLLPWSSPNLFQNDSLLFKKRFDQEDIYDINSVLGNTEGSEFGMVFLTQDDQSTVFYLSEQDQTKASEKVMKRIKTDYPVYNFYKANFDKTNFTLSNKVELNASINSLFQEGPGSYDPDTGYFYFTRSASKLDENKTVQLNLYKTRLSDLNQNKLPLALPFNVDGYSTIHPSLSPDGSRLYFASDRPGGFGGMDLYVVFIENGTFSEPINLGSDVNTEGDEVFPYSYNNRFLFFTSNGREGIGKMDVFLAENRIEKRWEVYILGKGINTTDDDFAFVLNQDLSLGHLSSNKSGGKGADDLYAFEFSPKIQGIEDFYEYNPSDTLVVALNNILTNDQLELEQQDPLQRLVEKEVEVTRLPLYGQLQLNKNGSFFYKNNAPIQPKDSFSYRLLSSKGNSEEVWVHLSRVEMTEEELSPVLADTFSPIFYDFDESTILNTYLDRVDKVVAAMQENPSLEVEISSYTDCRSSSEYNLKLSTRRTQSILDYVRKRISNPERIYGKGYGEDNGSTLFKNDYALVAGSFYNLPDTKVLMNKLIDMGYEPFTQKFGSKIRVLLSPLDSKNEIIRIRKELGALGIDTWVLINPCLQLTEEEHQQKRRTDFKVIRF